jgi:hypothetical protein
MQQRRSEITLFAAGAFARIQVAHKFCSEQLEVDQHITHAEHAQNYSIVGCGFRKVRAEAYI